MNTGLSIQVVTSVVVVASHDGHHTAGVIENIQDQLGIIREFCESEDTVT